MKQISNFMGEISDEFKIVVVEAIRVLTIKFPQKHRALMTFLASILENDSLLCLDLVFWTFYYRKKSRVAQGYERWAHNPQVRGSKPRSANFFLY